MSETKRKIVTIHLTENQAEALFCILRYPGDDHFLFNNNNGLTYFPEEDEEDEEELECEEMNRARLCAAWQVFQQMSDVAKIQHGPDVLAPGPDGKSFHIPAINNGETQETLTY